MMNQYYTKIFNDAGYPVTEAEIAEWLTGAKVPAVDAMTLDVLGPHQVAYFNSCDHMCSTLEKLAAAIEYSDLDV